MTNYSYLRKYAQEWDCWVIWQFCCKKADPYQGPKLGSCLTLGKELSEETSADKARDFIVKGRSGGEQEGKGTQENFSAP